MSIYDTLNHEQQTAVFHTEGPVLILAGAGSGKPTKCPSHKNRIFNRRKGGNPWEYMAIPLPTRQEEKCGNVWIRLWDLAHKASGFPRFTPVVRECCAGLLTVWDTTPILRFMIPMTRKR